MTEMPDIVDRLKHWASYKPGDALPNAWGPLLKADLDVAIAEIELLRMMVGAVSAGIDIAAIKKHLGTRKPQPVDPAANEPSN